MCYQHNNFHDLLYQKSRKSKRTFLWLNVQKVCKITASSLAEEAQSIEKALSRVARIK